MQSRITSRLTTHFPASRARCARPTWRHHTILYRGVAVDTARSRQSSRQTSSEPMMGPSAILLYAGGRTAVPLLNILSFHSVSSIAPNLETTPPRIIRSYFREIVSGRAGLGSRPACQPSPVICIHFASPTRFSACGFLNIIIVSGPASHRPPPGKTTDAVSFDHGLLISPVKRLVFFKVECANQPNRWSHLLHHHFVSLCRKAVPGLE